MWDDDQDYILWSFNVDGHRRRRHRRRQQDDRRLVHPRARQRLRRLQRQRQAGPGRAGRPAVPADRPRARQLADGPGHQHRHHRRQRRLRHPRGLPAGQVAGARGVQHPLPDHRHHLPGRERDRRRRPSSAAWSTSTSCRSSGSAARSTGASSRTTPGTNGGIVGTVSYDTTRNELDPADAATEGYQPGIPDVPGAPVRRRRRAPRPTRTRSANECRQGKEIVPLQVPDPTTPTKPIDNPDQDRGALVKGPSSQDTYTSEEWAPPRGCTATAVRRRRRSTDQQALPRVRRGREPARASRRR